MDASDEESCFAWALLFSFKISSGANQMKKEKDVGAGNTRKKIEQGVYHNLL